MAFPIFAPSPPPSPVNSQVTPGPRVLFAQFGDGYTQRASDGANTIARVAILQWDILTSAEMQTIRDFLLATNGVTSFQWTPFGESTAYTWALDWTAPQSSIVVTPINANAFKMRVTIRQTFDLAS